jgi:tetratricopeptide (TPR) repeat protein
LALLVEMGEVAAQRALGVTSDVTPNENHEAETQAFYEQAVRSYSEALRLQPNNGDAIQRFVVLCQRTHRYALMAEVLQRAPHTVEVLEALRAAYEELGEPKALAAVCEEQLAMFSAVPETPRAQILRTTRTLAELYQRLERPEDEARAWERLYELAPEELMRDVPALLILEKRYGQSGRHAEQTSLLSRAIERLAAEQAQCEATAPAADTINDATAAAILDLRERRKVLLLRLGDVQRDFLGSVAQATATFEQVLREWPSEPTALRDR